MEPLLGDLRARGQDQDAAVRGPAARRESLRGPRAAGQALQYRDMPGSVPPSPPAPPSPWDHPEMAPAKGQGHAPGAGLLCCEGWVAPPWGPVAARGHVGAVTWGAPPLSPLETGMKSRLRWPCPGGSSPRRGQRGPAWGPWRSRLLPSPSAAAGTALAPGWHGDVVGHQGGGQGGRLQGLSVRGWQHHLRPSLLRARSGCAGGHGVSAAMARDAMLGPAGTPRAAWGGWRQARSRRERRR